MYANYNYRRDRLRAKNLGAREDPAETHGCVRARKAAREPEPRPDLEAGADLVRGERGGAGEEAVGRIEAGQRGEQAEVRVAGRIDASDLDQRRV